MAHPDIDISVEITVKYTITGMISRYELEAMIADNTFSSLEDYVQWLIQEEGIHGIADSSEGVVINVQEVQP